MSRAVVCGIHHLKIPVADLDASLVWYRRIFGAEHVSALDHWDADGVRFAALVTIPGVGVPVELRWAPTAARALRECDVMILAVAADDLRGWTEHLDACDTRHSPLLTGPGGTVLVVADPDGKYIRLVAPRPDGSADRDLSTRRLDPHGPWLNPTPMQHPRIIHRHDESTEGIRP